MDDIVAKNYLIETIEVGDSRMHAYWVFVGLGLVFRYSLMRYQIFSEYEKIKRITGEIVGLLVLTLLWNCLASIEKSYANAGVFVMLITLAYCLRKLISKCPSGSTESLLLFVNTFMVTSLSFMKFKFCVPFSIIIFFISFGIYKFWKAEIKSDFYEIVLLLIEAIVLSLLISYYELNGFLETAAVVLFAETALCFLNFVLMCLIKKMCHEDIDDYVNALFGIGDY